MVRKFFSEKEKLKITPHSTDLESLLTLSPVQSCQCMSHITHTVESGALSDLFKPLDNQKIELESFQLQKLKGKGAEWKSYLRIYAVRFKEKIFVTGGAIKLPDKREDRSHANDELKKLELVKAFLEKGNPYVEFC